MHPPALACLDVPSDADRATREAYDVVAATYARLLPDMALEAPLDRAVLTAFVAMLEQSGDGPVADVGCGSGRVAAHLAAAAVRVVGLDLSPGMAATARASHPDLAFAVAHVGALPVRSAALGGLVAWYSLIHLPTDLLAGVFAEFARVTRPGATVVIAFQSGEGQRVDRATAYGHAAPLTYYRHRVEDVVDALAGAGFALHATVRREPWRAHETTPQAFLLAERGEQVGAPAGRCSSRSGRGYPGA